MNNFRLFLILFFLLIILFSSLSFGQTPSNPKLRATVNRVEPKLKSELKINNLIYGSEIFIRIFKESKELEVWIKKENKFEQFKVYKICSYGTDELGPKIIQGDGKAPEGFYLVNPKSMNPFSNYHLSFNLGYPNEYDRTHKRTGNALMVHGDCVSIGCYAMTNEGIEEIYLLADKALRSGQSSFKVHIFPFRMSDQNMEKYSKSEWFEFWKNLKEGYDCFEKSHVPPNVYVKNKLYTFSY